MSQRKVIIVGAGLAGSLFAIYLAKRGYAVDVFEKRPDMRESPISAGKSINLALSRRGIDALDKVGLAEKMLSIATPMMGRMMHSVEGKLTFQRYGKDDSEYINAVSRGELNKILMSEAELYPGVHFHFNEKCVLVDFDAKSAAFENEITGRTTIVQGETIIGADGAFSAARHDMALTKRFSLSKQFIDYGYKELHIPAGMDGKFLIEKNALHIWPRGNYMLIALPNFDGSFTCTLFFPFEGDPSFDRLKTEGDVTNFFHEQFPDVIPLMPDLTDLFFSNPTGDLVTIKCRPWHVGGSAVLLGDSAHAVVPFLGQGMNCAFEGCIILDECLERNKGNWEATYSEFERIHRPNSDALSEMALENFIEMRDKVADPNFLLKKKVGLALEERFAPKFITKYAMIQFHRTPYKEAMEIGMINQQIVDELCEGIESVEQVDWGKGERLVRGGF